MTRPRNSSNSTSHIPMWLTEPLSHDVLNSLYRLLEADDVQHMAVMPDVHLAGDVCVGTMAFVR